MGTASRQANDSVSLLSLPLCTMRIGLALPQYNGHSPIAAPLSAVEMSESRQRMHWGRPEVA
jgi:hypothetical protein